MIKNNVDIRLGSDVHHHSTRNRANFTIRICRTSQGAQNFYIRAFNNFNNLPQQIKAYHSLSIIKNRLREHYYEVYFDAN